MGFYDGLSGTSTTASAWQVADTLNLPVLLVVRPKGASLTLAAQIKGLQSFRTPSHLAGIFLNDCKPGLYKMLAPMLEAETGLPVAGFLPPVPEAAIGSRHLGLYTAGEVADLQQKIALLAQAAEENIHWEKLLSLCEQPAPAAAQIKQEHKKQCVKIAVARDEAFCFAYAETLEALTAAGAEIILFRGIWPMAGVLPGQGVKVGRLVRFGYATLTARADSLLFRAGEQFPVHEFHHWDSTENGTALTASKANGRQWACGFANEHFYAGFPHLYWAGTPLPERFVAAAESYQNKRGSL